MEKYALFVVNSELDIDFTKITYQDVILKGNLVNDSMHQYELLHSLVSGLNNDFISDQDWVVVVDNENKLVFIQ